MTSVHRFGGLAATRTGQTKQLDRAYRGIADDLTRSKTVEAADCDQPQTLEQALRVIASLQNQLTDAQALIADMRNTANSDAPAATSRQAKYWTTKQVAQKSGNKAISTITRNAIALGGIKVGSDWLFPVGTIHHGKRKSKAK